LKIHVLVSGSAGNCTLVESGETRVLVDCGVSGVEAERRLHEAGCPPEALGAILVTHEHTDHVQGVGILARRFGIPVHLTAGTMSACNGSLGRIEEPAVIEPGRGFALGGLDVHPFRIPHDAADPVGFTFHNGHEKAGIATDIGYPMGLVENHLNECNLLVIESNHDPEMLARGPYPPNLKKRIRGREGHLSNAQAGEMLERIVQKDSFALSAVILAHLSEKNNHPSLARKAAEKIFEGRRMEKKVRIEVAGREEVVTVST
jgi:phosphoribosyl 1,2-cyclic phosphodiesterase